MPLTVEGREAMRTYMQQERSERIGRLLLTVAPGAYWSPTRWPGEGCATVVRALAQMQGAAVVVLGRGEEAGLVQGRSQQLSVPGLNRTGTLFLMPTAALLPLCHLRLRNDSGLMPLATALRVLTVAIFGPTVQALGFYPGKACAQVRSAALTWRPWSTQISRRCPLCASAPTLWGGHGA